MELCTSPGRGGYEPVWLQCVPGGLSGGSDELVVLSGDVTIILGLNITCVIHGAVHLNDTPQTFAFMITVWVHHLLTRSSLKPLT